MEEEKEKEWLEGTSRGRNTVIETLTEGDILVIDDDYNLVTSGEITIYGDGTVDKQYGELQVVSWDVASIMINNHKHVFNMEDAK